MSIRRSYIQPTAAAHQGVSVIRTAQPLQERETKKLIAVADDSGNVRMAEMNRQVEGNLVSVINTIEHRAKEIAADDPS